jgi:hypothetical protein
MSPRNNKPQSGTKKQHPKAPKGGSKGGRTGGSTGKGR